MTDFEKSCCFTGHRKIESPNMDVIIKKLSLEIGWMIGHGITDFYAGGALGFDTIAALEILWYKQQGCPVKLHLMLPCPEQAVHWNEKDTAIYNDILNRADTVTVVAEKYHPGTMLQRNRAMVDASKYCICYYDHTIEDGIVKPKGGTLYTINYARKLERSIVNLCDDPLESYPIEFELDE